MKFDENTLNMSGMGDIMDDRENLSVILGILTENYKQIKRIIEKKPGINFMTDREILVENETACR